MKIMSIAEKYIQQQNARRENFGEKDEPKKKIEGPTLKEILTNKEQQDLFGEYLGAEGAEGLGIKLAEKTLDSSDFAALEEKRKGFLEILGRSKSIMESLDSRTLTKLVESSPDLQTIAGAVGNDGIRNALSKHLPILAITERQRFINIENSLGQLAESKKTIEKEDEEIKKWCKENGIAESEYLELLQTGDPEKVVKLGRSQYGFWKKLTTSRREEEDIVHQQSLDNAREIEEYWKNYEDNLRGVGWLLQLTMMENPTLRKTLIADIRKDVVETKDPGMSFSEMKEAIKTTPIKKEEFDAAFVLYKKGHPGMDEDHALHEFSQIYTNEKIPRRPGFWAKIFAVVFASNVENFMKNK
jgi:hypothetical protein